MTITQNTRATQRRQRLIALADDYPLTIELNITALIDGSGDTAYCLIERDVHDGGHWASIHPSPADAATYHLNDENRTRWEAVLLTDLDTGANYAPHYHLEFT